MFEEQGPINVAMPDATVVLWPSIPLFAATHEIFTSLQTQTRWQAEDIVLFGKRHTQPRRVCWHGDSGKAYTYSGITHQPLPWTPVLLKLKSSVESVSGHTFNSVLLNLYRDHRDSMGMHADDEPELGKAPVIASLSLGERRTLTFRHKRDKALASVKVPLASGSLLLMSGATQRNWKHGIAKERHPCGARINLTFRTIL